MSYTVVQDTDSTPCPCCRQDAHGWQITGPAVPDNLRWRRFYGEDGQQEAEGYAQALSEAATLPAGVDITFCA